jgi:predicted aspartyl protease
VESESEDDDEYSSLEDEGEVFIQGALNKKKRSAPKEYLPKHREPVTNPLSVEERVKRKETRVMNREASCQRNLAMIKAIAGEVVEKLATHWHIKHFRTDLHKYIDLSFNHVKDVPATMNVAQLENSQIRIKKFPAFLKPGCAQLKARDPALSRSPIPSHLTLPGRTSGVTNIKIDVDPKFDKTNYQTEIMIGIEQKPFRIIADSGATSSEINLSVVRELNLLGSMKPTEYTYRTLSGKVEKALGTVEVSLRIGPIVVKTDMVVMPSGCGYNMLLGNELMTTLRADIMRSLKVVRF